MENVKSEPALMLESVSVHFGGITAVDDVSLEVSEGSITALLGPNGAGKTTLFNVIAGAVPPSDGRVVYAGETITNEPSFRRCRRGISRTYQVTQPFLELTVEENVMVGSMQHYKSMDEMRDHAQAFIEFVDLGHKRRTFAKQLSTGQRKRLELARAMATKPRLLLLDEVTGGVDHAGIPELVKLVGRLRDESVTILLIEHNMSVVAELADQAFFLDRGAILAKGTPSELAEHPKVVELYLESEHA